MNILIIFKLTGILFVFEQASPQYFAVVPLKWCAHIEDTTPLQHDLDSSQPCQECSAEGENWVCLTCYQVSYTAALKHCPYRIYHWFVTSAIYQCFVTPSIYRCLVTPSIYRCLITLFTYQCLVTQFTYRCLVTLSTSSLGLLQPICQ